MDIGLAYSVVKWKGNHSSE